MSWKWRHYRYFCSILHQLVTSKASSARSHLWVVWAHLKKLVPSQGCNEAMGKGRSKVLINIECKCWRRMKTACALQQAAMLSVRQQTSLCLCLPLCWLIDHHGCCFSCSSLLLLFPKLSFAVPELVVVVVVACQIPRMREFHCKNRLVSTSQTNGWTDRWIDR